MTKAEEIFYERRYVKMCGTKVKRWVGKYTENGPWKWAATGSMLPEGETNLDLPGTVVHSNFTFDDPDLTTKFQKTYVVRRRTWSDRSPEAIQARKRILMSKKPYKVGAWPFV